MGCRSNYMEPTAFEHAASAVYAFIDEIETGKLKENHLNGNHPAVYGMGISQERLNQATNKLCKQCKKIEPKDFSLELQMWWRDHQKWDAEQKAGTGMTLFCLTHTHDNGVDSYLFEAGTAPAAGEVAAQLGVDFVLQDGEDVVVSVVANADLFNIPKIEE